ncbi:DHHA1 domain-containing protein, partial [Francisella tularensis]|uniref:DHHA1 domain-containing protein n=1 Tax=Francisella tularensis TaxID=263 RepID=UPI002381C183
MFGKAVIIFSQTQHDSTLISGSARSIDNIHIKTILDNIAVKEPQQIIKYGGHKGAAGLTIKKSDFVKFYQLFESEITDIIT